MVRTEYHRLDAPSLGGSGEVAVHGHWGRPVLWFPAEAGDAGEFQAQGMTDSLGPAIDEGRIKVFCVPAYDSSSWSDRNLSQGDRARAHRRFEDWIIWQVVPFIRDNCGGRDDIVTAGPSMGAFHAVLFALRHAHVFSRAVAFSGAYEPWNWHAWGDSDQDTYLTDPMQFLPRTYGAHLEHLRSKLYLTLVVGSGRCGRTPPARTRRRWPSPASWPTSTSPTNCTCGARSGPTTGRAGRRRPPFTYRSWAERI